MEKDEFAILHCIDGKQFLVDSTYNHETDCFELSIKYWDGYFNGFATVTMSWDVEQYFIDTFNKFKEHDYCIKWFNALKTNLHN